MPAVCAHRFVINVFGTTVVYRSPWFNNTLGQTWDCAIAWLALILYEPNYLDSPYDIDIICWDDEHPVFANIPYSQHWQLSSSESESDTDQDD